MSRGLGLLLPLEGLGIRKTLLKYQHGAVNTDIYAAQQHMKDEIKNGFKIAKLQPPSSGTASTWSEETPLRSPSAEPQKDFLTSWSRRPSSYSNPGSWQLDPGGIPQLGAVALPTGSHLRGAPRTGQSSKCAIYLDFWGFGCLVSFSFIEKICLLLLADSMICAVDVASIAGLSDNPLSRSSVFFSLTSADS